MIGRVSLVLGISVCMVLPSCFGGAHSTTASLPQASAIVVHACAAAEANAALARTALDPAKPDSGPVSKTTIELTAGGKVDSDVKVVSAEFGGLGESDREKVVTIELDGLPSLKTCETLGYKPQLGLLNHQPCLLSKPGCQASFPTSEPLPRPPKKD